MPKETITIDGEIIDEQETAASRTNAALLSPSGRFRQEDALTVGAITTSRLGAKPADATDSKKPLLLYTVWGRAKGIATRDSADGQSFVGIAGSLYAETYQEPAIYRAPIAFLPRECADLLIADIEQLGEGETLEFAVDIASVFASNPAGYHYKGHIRTNRPQADPAFAVGALLKPARQLLIGRD